MGYDDLAMTFRFALHVLPCCRSPDHKEWLHETNRIQELIICAWWICRPFGKVRLWKTFMKGENPQGSKINTDPKPRCSLNLLEMPPIFSCQRLAERVWARKAKKVSVIVMPSGLESRFYLTCIFPGHINRANSSILSVSLPVLGGV